MSLLPRRRLQYSLLSPSLCPDMTDGTVPVKLMDLYPQCSARHPKYISYLLCQRCEIFPMKFWWPDKYTGLVFYEVSQITLQTLVYKNTSASCDEQVGQMKFLSICGFALHTNSHCFRTRKYHFCSMYSENVSKISVNINIFRNCSTLPS